MKIICQTLLLLLLSGILSVKVYAHEVRPAYLEITEDSTGEIKILWKQPTMGEVGLRLMPEFSSFPLPDSLARVSATSYYLIRTWKIPSPHASLNGQSVTIIGLDGTITDVLVRITYANGQTQTKLIKPNNPTLHIQQEENQSAPVWEYLQLGILHILTGVDHLLFVLGLILLVRGRRRLLITITAFTVAHSITLALATLHIIQVLPSPVEAVIALSIMFLAVELVRHYHGIDHLTYRFPWIVAFTFGLLHGLGFAGALAQVGLPQNSIPFALFLFNAGVEIGQLFFVFTVLLLMWFIKLLFSKIPVWTKWIPPYAIGAMAGYWFIERMARIIFWRNL
jgi:hydrogenase/urease accessory protein HupE